MLYLISIGLFNENDMSVNAVETAMHCDELFVEFYTSQINTTAEKLSSFLGKPVRELKREDVEDHGDRIVTMAKEKDIGLLVGGDCLTATTHISLILDAKKSGIKTCVIHGSSIYTAVCETGLQIYKFGRTTTLPSFKARSCYEVLETNRKTGLHSLVLLDIGMSIRKGVEALVELENEEKKGIVTSETKLVACCRLGSHDRVIKYGTPLKLINDKELEKIQAVLIIPGELHFKEEESLETFRA
jgi:diphthine synthase